MEKKTRLGRGLDALIGTAGNDGATVGAAEVSLDAIECNPYQPRKEFDDDEMSSLRESIKTHGVLQPVVVRAVGDHYQLIAGERRVRAARAAGLPAVPVRVVDFNDQEVVEAALIENIQRADLNAIEKALGFKDYLDRFKMTHDQLARRLGLSRPTITNLVALLDLPDDVQEAIRLGTLTTGHAKLLKGLSPDRQTQLAKEMIGRGLSVHAAEAFMKQIQSEAGTPDEGRSETTPASSNGKTTHVQSLEDELRQKLGLKLEIKVKGKDRGQFVVNFESNDDFERLVEILRR